MSNRLPAGLSGNLRLVCAFDPGRGTYLAKQAFSAPIHLSKSYWDGDTLLVNVVNQTAGIFGGDTIVTHVVVEPKARVLLTSPSAARFCPSQGRSSRLEQTLHVRSGGSLDVFPELSIPQRESFSFQKTSIHVEPGGELIYLETLAPGRVASGEAFAFTRYGWSTDIRVGDGLIHRERVSLHPHDFSVAGLRAFFPVSYYAGIILVSPVADSWSVDFLHAVAALGREGSIRLAATRLGAHGWSMRILAADSLALHEGIRTLRQLIYDRLGRRPPDTRRNR